VQFKLEPVTLLKEKTHYENKNASAGNRTRVNCLEGSYAHHYTTDALYQRAHYHNLLNAIKTFYEIASIHDRSGSSFPLQRISDTLSSA
jgi:hypothetical protein